MLSSLNLVKYFSLYLFLDLKDSDSIKFTIFDTISSLFFSFYLPTFKTTNPIIHF